MGIDAISYGLSKWKGELCSTCSIFTDKNHSFMPVGRIVTSGGIDAVKKFYKELGPDYVKALNDMFVLDALIYNTDRHFGNFGFIIDSCTNKIIAPAPLFDHGNSLFNYAGIDDLESTETLSLYADTMYPCVYDDFVTCAKEVLTSDHRKYLRNLLEFKFKKNSRYNLPDKRLKLIEKQIQKRAKELLE